MTMTAMCAVLRSYVATGVMQRADAIAFLCEHWRLTPLGAADALNRLSVTESKGGRSGERL